jgi:hypothetical protein
MLPGIVKKSFMLPGGLVRVGRRVNLAAVAVQGFGHFVRAYFLG